MFKNKIILLLISMLLISWWIISNNSDWTADKPILKIGIASTYPPFEYKKDGELVGLDVDLGRLVAKELNMDAQFIIMQFSSLLPALDVGKIDAVISGLTITEEREKNISFSKPYLYDDLAVMYQVSKPYSSAQELEGKLVAVELGTTMHIWAKEKLLNSELQSTVSNLQAVEALNAGLVDAVIIDESQAYEFSKKKEKLTYSVIDRAEHGYGVGLKKNSKFLTKVNKALDKIISSGKMKELEKKWLVRN